MTTKSKASSNSKFINWGMVLIEGLFAIIFGLLLLFYPAATTGVLVQFLGIYLLVKGVLSFASIFHSPKGWFWKVILGILCVVAGFIILNHPLWSGVVTPVILTVVMSLLAIFIGLIALIQAVNGGGWGVGILGFMIICLGFLVLYGSNVVSLYMPYVYGFLFLAGGLFAVIYAVWIGFTSRKVAEAPAALAGEVAVQPEPAAIGAAVKMAETASLEQETVEMAAIGEQVEAVPASEAGFAAIGGVGSTASVVGVAATATGVGWALEEWGDKPAEQAGTPAEPVVEAPVDEMVIAGLVVAAASRDADEEGIPEVLPEEVIPVLVEQPTEEATVSEAAEEAASTEGENGSNTNLAAVQARLLHYDMEYVEGIGPVYAEKLKAIGIINALDLLQRGATRRGRAEIVEKSGISSKLVLRWINHADLFRINGIGSEYADLLESAGVDTVIELANRVPERLHPTIKEVNTAKRLVRQTPSLSMVQKWVEQAQQLPRVIRY